MELSPALASPFLSLHIALDAVHHSLRIPNLSFTYLIGNVISLVPAYFVGALHMYRTHNSTRFMSRDQILFQKQLKGLSPKPLQLHNLLVLCSHLFGITVSSIKGETRTIGPWGVMSVWSRLVSMGRMLILGRLFFSL